MKPIHCIAKNVTLIIRSSTTNSRFIQKTQLLMGKDIKSWAATNGTIA